MVATCSKNANFISRISARYIAANFGLPIVNHIRGSLFFTPF